MFVALITNIRYVPSYVGMSYFVNLSKYRQTEVGFSADICLAQPEELAGMCPQTRLAYFS